jgi:hypothetical protein
MTMAATLDLRSVLLDICHELLKRHPLRRGGLIITDADLRKTIAALSRPADEAAE